MSIGMRYFLVWLVIFCVALLGVIITTDAPKAQTDDKFFRNFVQHKHRATDIIKFKWELKEALDKSVALKTKTEVLNNINSFMASNKARFRPYHYTIEEDGDEINFMLFISVYYDSFQFESFNFMHYGNGASGVNYSDSFKELIKK